MFRIRKITTRGLLRVLLICNFFACSAVISAQADKKFIRQGNKEFDKNNFAESEVYYRKAINKNEQSPEAVFNIGDALYKQKKYEEAGKQFMENTSQNEDKLKKSAGMYNLGNSLLMANKVKESIDAYESSLKLNPKNVEAKYNLGYAQDLLKEQQQQKQQQQQNKDSDKQDQNKDQSKDDQNKNQNDNKKDQQKDQNNNDNKNQQQQQQQQSISKEDAQRILNALANDEKNVQKKVKLAKAASERVRTVKNW